MLKAVARRILGKPTIPHVEGAADASWYDAVFTATESFQRPYQFSHYYCLWTVIADRIRHAGAKRVLDIGCGPGQLAACLFDLTEITHYVGLDFSPKAIEMARVVCPRGQFHLGDALTSTLYEEPHDVTICTEVLEHIPDDFGVLRRMTGRVLCTVPNFPWDSHVRHFNSADEVRERYAHMFTTCDVWALKGHQAPKNVFFLLDGVRA